VTKQNTEEKGPDSGKNPGRSRAQDDQSVPSPGAQGKDDPRARSLDLFHTWGRAGSDPLKFVELIRKDIKDPEELAKQMGSCFTFPALWEAVAALPLEKYDLFRKRFVENTPFRLSTVDDKVFQVRGATASKDTAIVSEVEPWGETVDGSDLFDMIHDYIRSYVVFAAEADAIAVSVWAFFSHCHGIADCSPFLAFCSPEKRCGKTRGLEVTSRLVPRPLATASISPAALFRTIEECEPTLLIDEADRAFRGSDGNEELRCLLNSGHTKTAAFTIRCDGEDHAPTKFSTWAPKIIALIGKLPDTLEDRSIIINMRRKLPTDKVQRFRGARDGDLPVRMLARWAKDNSEALQAAPDPEMPSGLDDRQADNWRLLLTIADLIGRGDLVRAACSELCTGRTDTDTDNARLMLLEDTRTIIGTADAISSASLLSGLIAMEERPWPTWHKGKPISMRSAAGLLRPFGIKSKLIRDGKDVFRRYSRADFTDAFTRYLPPADPAESTPVSFSPRPEGDLSVTPVTSPESLDNSANSIRYKDDSVTDKNNENTNNINGVTGVTDKKGEYRGGRESSGKKRPVALATPPVLSPAALEKLKAASRAEAQKLS